MKTKSKPWNGRPKVRTWTSLKMHGWKWKLSYRKFLKVDSRDQLYGKIFQIWTNISVDYIRNLYSSIPKRKYAKFRLLEVTSLNIKVSQSSLSELLEVTSLNIKVSQSSLSELLEVTSLNIKVSQSSLSELLEVTSLNIKVSQSSLYIFYMLSLHESRSWY